MAIKLNSVKCPECGASLPIEEGREKLFCSYCGTQIIVTNENEHIYRHVDEAKIREAEAAKAIQLKKLEIIERKRAAAEKMKKVKLKISIVLGVIGILLMIIGQGTTMISLIGMMVLSIIIWIWVIGDTNKEDDLDIDDKVKVPFGIDDYEKKSYIAIEAMLKGAGFTNVTCIPLHDLRTGLFTKPDTVESITINGEEIESGEKYPPNATVVISYHSYI